MMDKWHRLYNWLLDTSFAITPDERYTDQEYLIRKIKCETLEAIIDIMIEFEREEKENASKDR